MEKTVALTEILTIDLKHRVIVMNGKPYDSSKATREQKNLISRAIRLLNQT